MTNLCLNFLGNVKTENYKELVEDLLNAYQAMGCNMSFKIHFLHSHSNFFPPNLGPVSDGHGESFHQDICTTEKRYEGKSSRNMLTDCFWNLTEEVSIASYKGMSFGKTFLYTSKMKHLFSHFVVSIHEVTFIQLFCRHFLIPCYHFNMKRRF
jgi:hypothetical protein